MKTNCDDASRSKTNLLTLTHLPSPDLQCINLLCKEGFSFCTHWSVCLFVERHVTKTHSGNWSLCLVRKLQGVKLFSQAQNTRPLLIITHHWKSFTHTHPHSEPMAIHTAHNDLGCLITNCHLNFSKLLLLTEKKWVFLVWALTLQFLCVSVVY